MLYDVVNVIVVLADRELSIMNVTIDSSISVEVYSMILGLFIARLHCLHSPQGSATNGSRVETQGYRGTQESTYGLRLHPKKNQRTQRFEIGEDDDENGLSHGAAKLKKKVSTVHLEFEDFQTSNSKFSAQP